MGTGYLSNLNDGLIRIEEVSGKKISKNCISFSLSCVPTQQLFTFTVSTVVTISMKKANQVSIHTYNPKQGQNNS